MADWYVYQHDGEPLGPWSTDTVAEAILAGKLAPDVWVAAPGGPRWLRALDVPVIGRMVEGIPTRPRRDSGRRLIPTPFPNEDGLIAFGSTVMIVRDGELEGPGSHEAPATTRNAPLAQPERAGDTAQMPVMPVMSLRVASVREPDVGTGTDFFGAAREPDDLRRLVAAAETAPGFDDDDPSTDPAIPPSSTTPSPLSGLREDMAVPADTDRRHRKGA